MAYSTIGVNIDPTLDQKLCYVEVIASQGAHGSIFFILSYAYKYYKWQIHDYKIIILRNTLVSALILAPWSSSISTIALWPLELAMSKAVLPLVYSKNIRIYY